MTSGTAEGAKRPWGEIGLVAGALLVLTVLHYTTAPDRPLLHDLYRRLYYIPIIYAAFRFGLLGGLLASLGATLLFLPHVFIPHIHFMGLHAYPRAGATDALFEVLLFNVIAWVTGTLAEGEKRQRKKVIQSQEELRRADRLTVLGEMASMMAHEVRNPLGAIAGAVEMLKKTDPSVPPADGGARNRELLDILSKEVSRLNRVVTDFLSYARPAKPERVQVHINQLLEESLALIRNQAEANKVQIEWNPDAPSLEVRADPQQLKQAFLNIELNAVQAMPQGGRLTVDCALIQGAGKQKTLRVRFSDTGAGMPPEVLEKALDVFYTTKQGGTGLGLAVVQRIAEGHGGAVRIESQIGRGTRVTLEVPA